MKATLRNIEKRLDEVAEASAPWVRPPDHVCFPAMAMCRIVDFLEGVFFDDGGSVRPEFADPAARIEAWPVWEIFRLLAPLSGFQLQFRATWALCWRFDETMRDAARPDRDRPLSLAGLDDLKAALRADRSDLLRHPPAMRPETMPDLTPCPVPAEVPPFGWEQLDLWPLSYWHRRHPHRRKVATCADG